MPIRFLDSGQQTDLTELLSTVLTGDPLIDAVAAIDFACAWAESEIRLEKKTPGWTRAERGVRFKHFSALLVHATAVQDLLRANRRPLPGTIDLDWTAFDDALATVINSTRREVAAARPGSKRGRPPEEWRDRLITVVFSVYPVGAAMKTTGSHFEETVRMLLEYLGRELEDIHSVTLDALHRQPAPPFTLRLKRPMR
jgi:hypothetical protein